MTRVVRTSLGDLPQLSAAAAVALTQAARVVASRPARFEVSIGELGVVEVSCEGVVPLFDEAARATADVVLGLTRASGAGRLVVDGALARGLVAAALGISLPPAAPLARLGLAQQGIVAGLVASVLASVGAPFSVSLVAPSSTAVADGAAIACAVRTAVGSGWIRLELPGRWLAAEAERASVARELDLEARVELARTRLLAPELARLEVGDAIVFDGEPAAPSLSGRAVRVALGTAWAGGRVGDDGAFVIVIEEAWQAGLAAGELVASNREASDETGRVTMRDRGEVPEGTHDASARTVDLAEVLANVPVEVVAELGRVVLRADEAAALAPGAVLRLGGAGAGSISLRVGDQLWAKGELVAVDGELGVRVTAARGRGLP